MWSLLSLLPVLLTVLLLACLTKLSAVLLKRTQVSWRHSFAFGGIAVLVALVGKIILVVVPVQAPIFISIVLGCALQLAAGGWFFANRATTSVGTRVGVAGGAQLAAIAIGIFLACSLGLLFLSQALLQRAP
jgi:hypothetical protein